MQKHQTHTDTLTPLLEAPPVVAQETLPNLQTAHAHVTALRKQLNAAKSDFTAAESRASGDFRAVAEGAPVDPAAMAEINALITKERILRVQLGAAESALKRAENRAVIRTVLEKRFELDSLISEGEQEAHTVEHHLTNAAIGLARQQANGARILDVFRSLRGRDMQTDSGIVPLADMTSLATPGHLQLMVDHQLNGQLGWWQVEAPLQFRSPGFAESATAAGRSLRSMLDLLLDLPSDADPADIAAVESAMAGDRVAASSTQPTNTAR